MTILSVEIPDEYVDRVTAAFDKAYNYKSTRTVTNEKGEDVEMEQTPLEFVESELARFVVNVTDAYVINTARDTATENAKIQVEEHKDIKSSAEIARADEIAVLEPVVADTEGN